MSLKHQLLAAAYHPLKLVNSLLGQTLGRQGGRLRVLLYHDIAPADEERFAAQLRWLSRSWRFISPEEFSTILSTNRKIQEDSLLLTFDDGFVSNRRVAEKVLNPMGIKALFFVVSEFVALAPTADWRGFVTRNIHPGFPIEAIPSHWCNMNWEDLRYLLDLGHSIGAHTARHARLSQVSDEDLKAEIVFSADKIEQKLGCKICHFAYTFGDLDSFSPAALEVARTRFDFIHTGFRGVNTSEVPLWAIRRDAITANDSLGLVGALLEGGADHLYQPSLVTYGSWVNNGYNG